MFSPATRKLRRKSAQAKDQNRDDTPSTPPLPSSSSSPSVRPITGTPAPWSSRLSIPSRLPAVKKEEKGDDGVDQTRPVFVGEFPQVVRNAQANLLQTNISSERRVVKGGIDKGTSLAWMICGAELYIWSYASSSVSKNCVVLQVPSQLFSSLKESNWAVCMLAWDKPKARRELAMLEQQHTSLGIILCNQTTRAVAYWPDIYSKQGINNDPIIDLLPKSDESESERSSFNSIIAAPVPGSCNECIAIACQPNATLTLFQLSENNVHRKKFSDESCEYMRSLVWQPKRDSSDLSFLLLTNHEIQCWSVIFSPTLSVKKVWAHLILGNDGDLGIKKDLAGQKHVWLLDLQIDERGREIIILVATFCKDRNSSSNYFQYSLLTMQYNSRSLISSQQQTEKVLEKKAPLQVIIPKARFEDEETLFSMRLKIGGKPSGSVTILSEDGTATVANNWRGSMRLYQFDLPWDASKVLDASILATCEDEMESEGGAWVVLTENAGVWAIPEKAVVVGGVEPPERSLSRKGSTNEGQNDSKRVQLRKSRSEAWRNSSVNKAPVFAQRGGERGSDEELEALLFRAFHDFVLSGGIEADLGEKLREKGAFEKEGETNVLARVSRSIVDTLAKHWTTNRGADFAATAVVSSLLFDKKEKHEKFLQFLALTKCHDQLSSKQRNSMLNIMEHGEKLSSLIHLRELQSMLLSQQQESINGSGSLWKLIQLVGEKARRNNVILMDRDNVEVFYSKVSDLEEFFSCLSHYLHHIITDTDNANQSVFLQQIHHAFELSNACITLIQTAVYYKQEHLTWYPSLEGLTPWISQPVVRSGLWALSSFLIELSKEASTVGMEIKEEMLAQMQGLTDGLLEAYNACIVAKDERGEETKGLSQEYHSRTDQLVGCLYQFAKMVAQTKYQEAKEGGEDQELKESIMRDIYSSIMLTAMRHGAHQTLWDICYDLSDASLLRNLMHDCVGFSEFAFKQFIKRGEYSKLLRLGEEFGDELACFLKDRIDLLWLHNIFIKNFSSASETLHALALDDNSSSCYSVRERRWFLYLSKIAALAGKEDGFELKIGRIEADLRILKLQEEIVGKGEEKKRELIGPVDLIKICLNKRDRNLALKAFEVFAFTSASFRSSNKTLLEECWSNAVDQDDWPALYQSSISQGWTDDIIIRSLSQTVLYEACNRCYGCDAQVFEGGFEEVLSLSSVEKVVMGHSYFADAGKLMLTALALGKEDRKSVDDVMES
ncbi:hypothetical protein LUZ60_011515 [Juncus effusus]|nr:hypothetical protein LUZ60_011515 [Juncus effusus]